MIHVTDLEYRYPKAADSAVRGISFAVREGEIFGFLGPSGAGKSTTQNIVIGLLQGYRGSAQVMGKEISSISRNFYEEVGVGFELPNLFSKFTALENLQFFASLYRKKTLDPMMLLERLGLKEDAHMVTAAYSKGMKTRLNFCRALIHDPKLLFLDEPTTGLDPVNAHTVREIIRELKEQGKTIFLTTHSMLTADALCDRVAFILDGRIPLIDTPRTLKIQRGKQTVHVEYREGGILRRREFPLKELSADPSFLNLLTMHEIETIHTQEATLEDVFLSVTGRTLA